MEWQDIADMQHHSKGHYRKDGGGGGVKMLHVYCGINPFCSMENGCIFTGNH